MVKVKNFKLLKMKGILLILMLINTSCLEAKKDIKSVNNKHKCEIEFDRISDLNYLKQKLDDFNSEDTDCIEAFFSYSKVVFNKENLQLKKHYLMAIEFIHDNSNSLSSTIIEGYIFNDVFYNNINFISRFLYENKNSNLREALEKAIPHEYVVYEGKERDEKYNALYKKIALEIENDAHKIYIKTLIDDIDRNLYD